MNQHMLVDYFLSTPRRHRHRYVGRQWFVYDEGDWVFDLGNIKITQAIIASAQEINWVRGGMAYVIDQVRRLLAVHLRADRLPAHMDAYVTPAGLTSEPQAPAAPSAPAPTPVPGLPVVDPDLAPVDLADTASPTGHTP